MSTSASATKRRIGLAVSAVVAAAGCWSVVIACSSEESREASEGADAADAADAALPTMFDGAIGKTDAGACRAVAPKRPLAVSPPKKFQPGACSSAAQMHGYVKGCLENNTGCKAYKSANAACATCAESTSADPAWGPVVFYENGQFYDYNYGGCIANVTGDLGASGCGAAQTRYLECRHAACVGCLPTGFPIDFAPFYACESSATTDAICRTEQDESKAACTTYFASGPKDACQGGGLASLVYIEQLITAFCGPDASDAGDAGDGGD